MRAHLNRPTTLSSAVALVAMLAFSSVSFAQAAQPAQGGQMPAQGRGRGAAAPSPTASLPFDPHDFSGVWRYGGTGFTTNNAPPMTPSAQAKYDAAVPGLGGAAGRNKPLGNDPIMFCDPIGYPRVMSFGAYPMEMIQVPGRIMQFFDFFYTYRTIWTDGRKLPDDPEPTWYGYAVGHWDGNTFVVESTGFNGRAWVANGGYPYSEDAKLEERYTRVDHDTINITMTLADPTSYTKPWVSGTSTLKWSPKETMREDVCAPSDEKKYLDEIREPAGHKGE
jgi:hypothetical protein